MSLTERLGGKLLDPLKTTVVQDQRAMTTWVVRKRLTGFRRFRGSWVPRFRFGSGSESEPGTRTPEPWNLGTPGTGGTL